MPHCPWLFWKAWLRWWSSFAKKAPKTILSKGCPFILVVKIFYNLHPNDFSNPQHHLLFVPNYAIAQIFCVVSDIEACSPALSPKKNILSTHPVTQPSLQDSVIVHILYKDLCRGQNCFLFPLSLHGLVLMPLFCIYHNLMYDNCLYPSFFNKIMSYLCTKITVYSFGNLVA